MTDTIKPTTETDARNFSTKHQAPGDARRPSDTLDRDQPREDREPNPGQPQENVEDRPNVSQVSPEDYPQDRADR